MDDLNSLKSKNLGKKFFAGELALCMAVCCSTFGIDLMLKSNFGISSISSVPYVFSRAFTFLTFGTWNYLFQTSLITALMFLRKRFSIEYFGCFVVGVIFGKSLDMFNFILANLPVDMMYLRIIYFILSFIFIAFGITFANNCGLPIVPTDIFPRDLAWILEKPYRIIKTRFDLICLSLTIILSLAAFHKVIGAGIGTVICAFTTGKAVSIINDFMCKRFYFAPIFFAKK